MNTTTSYNYNYNQRYLPTHDPVPVPVYENISEEIKDNSNCAESTEKTEEDIMDLLEKGYYNDEYLQIKHFIALQKREDNNKTLKKNKKVYDFYIDYKNNLDLINDDLSDNDLPKIIIINV